MDTFWAGPMKAAAEPARAATANFMVGYGGAREYVSSCYLLGICARVSLEEGRRRLAPGTEIPGELFSSFFYMRP